MINKKNFKNYKINQLINIKQNYNYIFLFQYNDLKCSEYILIKKQLKKFNCQFFILKQNLSNSIFYNLKGQGSILLIYSNEINFKLIDTLLKISKIKLNFLNINNKIYSQFKLKNLLNTNSTLNFNLIKSFIILLNNLKNIKMADIT